MEGHMAKELMTFRVTWVIDIDATGPREAARKAKIIQMHTQKPEGDNAVVYTIEAGGSLHAPPHLQYQRWHIDLDDKAEDCREFPQRVSRRMALKPSDVTPEGIARRTGKTVEEILEIQKQSGLAGKATTITADQIIPADYPARLREELRANIAGR
jgi:hypothetical protein